MKTLLIPFFFVAAALTANAHCGSCGVGEDHAKPAAEAKAECPMKKACADGAACAEKKACADGAACKEKGKACAEGAACEAKDKTCSAGCEKPCCAAKKGADKAAEKAAGHAKSEIPMPKMACCAGKE